MMYPWIDRSNQPLNKNEQAKRMCSYIDHASKYHLGCKVDIGHKKDYGDALHLENENIWECEHASGHCVPSFLSVCP